MYRFLLKKDIYNGVGINVLNCKIIQHDDTHGGLQNDGDLFILVECNNINKKELARIEEWRKLPLTQNLVFEIYGDMDETTGYYPSTAEKYKIPLLKNGYYAFINKNSKNNKLGNIENGIPNNYILAIYDSDKKMLYYFEHDV